ncbi:hypothetical protein WJX72_008283 [[Myrmecia] bisecta]|uniref:GIY-YIG domain-containing protein n=1 Tax=[Myrmecia] bisecta TaxID=41462 RepID=A0AAW1R8J1_9CHLO
MRVSAAADMKTAKMPPEAKEYWTQQLDRVDRNSAKPLLKFLDLNDIVGVQAEALVKTGRSFGRAPLYTYHRDIKKLHPTKVVLVRVGEFYESLGVDAVILVQFGGLNPMGANAPRAGCPKGNIRKLLHDLVQEAGLSVAICEESPAGYGYGSKSSKRKERFLAGVVTPASPHYMHGQMDDTSGSDILQTPPIIGISYSVGGFKVIAVDAELRTCRVTEQLSEDAAFACLHEGGVAPPLYLHTSALGSQGWEQRAAAIFRSQAYPVKKYDDPDPVAGLLNRIKLELDIKPDERFQMIRSRATDRPKPLYYSTAGQLGLHKTSGAVSLLDRLVPDNTPLVTKSWLRQLLLHPPPPHVAAAIHDACQILSGLEVPVPQYHRVTLPVNKIVLTIRQSEGNERFFRELADVLRAVQGSNEPLLRPFAEQVLPAVMLETGLVLDMDALAESCRECIDIIEAVVEPVAEDVRAPLSDSSLDEDSSEEDEFIRRPGARVAPQGVEVLRKLFNTNEDFRGKVRRHHVKDALQQYEDAGQAVYTELERVYTLVREHSLQHDPGLKAASQPSVTFDAVNNAVWLKIQKQSKTFKAGEKLGLIHPRDRNGKKLETFLSTEALEEALDNYRIACIDARKAVRDQLKQLAQDLKPRLAQLVGASTFAVVAAALDAHVNEAKRRHWTLPTQLPPAAAGAKRPPMVVEGVWPYWLEGQAPHTVRNSFTMDNMYLLTGPNMAGKSTVLRSVCSVALLAGCGLFAPVQRAVVPHTDAFMLRTFASDSPAEGKSAFAIEMEEMKYVCADATQDSLVLIDELGKGTEVKSGTVLAGAFLERLDATRCRGMFATHLHDLLSLPLVLPNMVRMRMETQAIDPNLSTGISPNSPQAALLHELMGKGVGGKRPTWRMIPGICTESLALDVAMQQGVDSQVVQRAATLMQHYLCEEQRRADLLQPSYRLGSNQLPLPPGLLTSGSPPDDEASSSHAAPARTSPAGPSRAAPRNGAVEPEEDPQTSTAARNRSREPSDVSSTSSAASFASKAAEDDFVLEALRKRYQYQLVLPGRVPPPSTVNSSCVYVVRRADGYFYCGETDDIKRRLATHRGKRGLVKGGRELEAAYVVMPSGQGGKSLACAIEAQVIKELQREGFPLISSSDARTKRMPKAA